MLQKSMMAALLMISIAACETEQGITPTGNEPGTAKIVTREGVRAQAEGILASRASGPAAMLKNARESKVSESAAIGFEPNAGAIWTDPSTGLTHLLALQLPAVPGSRGVKSESLGTGWEGSELITMDRQNFYVVWGDAVYKQPKTSPGNWSLIVPNNGEDIKAIKGFQSNSTVSIGFYMVRGNCMTTVNASGGFGIFYGCNEAFANCDLMGHYRSTVNGGFSMLFRTTDFKTWSFSNLPDGVLRWNSPNSIQNLSMLSVVGNPVTGKFYSSRLLHVHGPTIMAEVSTEGEGSGVFFSDIDYTPANSSLVVNNGYVWIMSNALHQVMTLGSQKGSAAYSEWGWDGISIACADATLIIN